MDEKYIQDLYSQLGGKAKFGSFEDFKFLITTDKSYQKDFYNSIGKKTLGEFNDFTSLVSSPVKKKDSSDGTGQPSPEVSSTQTGRTKPLSGTEKRRGQKASDGLGGRYEYSAEGLDVKTKEALGIKPREPEEIIPDYQPVTQVDIKKREREKLYREPVKESTFVAPTTSLGKIKESKEELKSDIEKAKENAKEKTKLTAKKKIEHYESLGENPNESFSVYNAPVDERDDQRRILEKSFVDSYFNPEDLAGIGINPVDFDGFLERKNLKGYVLDRDLKGGFGDKEENKIAKQAYLSNLLKMYLDEKEFVINDYEKSLKQSENPEFGVEDKPSYSYDRTKYREYLRKNLPDLDRSLKIKEAKEEQEYKDILEKEGNVALESLYSIKSLGKGILSVFPSPEIEKDTLPVNTIIDFKGVTLGIYTLTETSALRAKGILESMFKGLNVELNFCCHVELAESIYLF
jgi:hypothetical protein